MDRAPETGCGRSGALEYAWVCRTGPTRDGNEDDLGIVELARGRLLAVVADGMGGHNDGEVASRLAVETVLACDRDALSGPFSVATYDAVLAAVLVADERIGDLVTGVQHNPGCTVVVAVVDESAGVLHVHAGDCRLYQMRGGEVAYRTVDHSLAETAFRDGLITEDRMLVHPMAGVVTSCLGGDSDSQPEVEPRWLEGTDPGEQPAILSVPPGDVLLLCSDGVSGVAPRTTIANAAGASSNPAELVAALEECVLGLGAPDNYTALAIRVRTE